MPSRAFHQKTKGGRSWEPQWDALQCWFITTVDKTNLLCEFWDMIFNGTLIIINMLLLNILADIIKLQDRSLFFRSWLRVWGLFHLLPIIKVKHDPWFWQKINCFFYVFSFNGFSNFWLNLRFICKLILIILTGTLWILINHTEMHLHPHEGLPCNRKYSFRQVVGVKFLTEWLIVSTQTFPQTSKATAQQAVTTNILSNNENLPNMHSEQYTVS